MFDCIDGVLITNIWKCIISTILKIIHRSNIDWINVVGLFFCLPTAWYHMAVMICSIIGMTADRMCK